MAKDYEKEKDMTGGVQMQVMPDDYLNYSPYFKTLVETSRASRAENAYRGSDIQLYGQPQTDTISTSGEYRADAQGLTPYLKAYYLANEMKIARKQSVVEGLAEEEMPIYVQMSHRKRRFPLVIAAVALLLVFAVVAIGAMGIVPEYVSVFNKASGENISYVDPVFAALVKFAKLDFESVYYTDCLANIGEVKDIMVVIAIYALPFVAVFAMLFALIAFVNVVVGLFGRTFRKGFVAKKHRFGALIIAQLLLLLAYAVIGTVWNGYATEFEKFFMFKATFVNIGYGLYILIGLTVISLISSLFAYKKLKEEESIFLLSPDEDARLIEKIMQDTAKENNK